MSFKKMKKKKEKRKMVVKEDVPVMQELGMHLNLGMYTRSIDSLEGGCLQWFASEWETVTLDP